MTEQITKIKVCNDDTAVICYKKDVDLGIEEITYTGEEKITEVFANTFRFALNSVLEIMPALKTEKHNLELNTISLAYVDENIDKVSYTVKYKPQKNVSTNIPINNVPIYKDSFNEKTFSVSGKDVTLLYDIVECARSYIAGDTRTKQMKLEVVDS